MSAKHTEMVLMPKCLTAENGAKALLSCEFFENIESVCPDCAGDDDYDCDLCDGSGYIASKVMVSWTTIKRIYDMAVKHLGKPV